MKLGTWYDDGPRLGAVKGDTLWDLREAYSLYLFETERDPNHREFAARLVPDDMRLFIRLNHGRLSELNAALEFAASLSAPRRERISRPVDTIRVLSPILHPTKIVCCGNSYARYLREWGLPIEEWPQDVKISFLKPPTSLIGHGEEIRFPPDSEQWDYENELAVVIGRTCSGITPEDAEAYIFGYSILNDACVRDIPKWTGRYDSPRGKAGDTFAPFGPWIVPKEFLAGDPNDLRILTTVDGEMRQDDRTSGLLWSVQRIVAFVSRYIKLVPGDIISTGSTTGNALVNGKWLRPAQTIRCEIEGIGVLENRVGVKQWSKEFPPLATSR